MSQCQSSCVVPASWDCDGQGNCYDPGTGNGQFSSLISCESECVNVSVNEIGLNNLMIYPNPSKDIFNLELSTNNINNISVKIINIVGEIIFEDNLTRYSGTYKQTVDLTSYSIGVYLFKLDTDNGTIIKKLIRQ